MPPHKQPPSLFICCVRSSICLINSACYFIEKSYPEDNYVYDQQTCALKCYLMSMLPARLLDVLCSKRTCVQYRGDPRTQLRVLMHPNMTVFRKSDLDSGVPQSFWIDKLPFFNKLTVLDLKFICTDEILQVISKCCPPLEEINIVSRVDICKSPFNASVLIRNVSDAGLCAIASLKTLRVLAMDPPRNERANRVGRCVSQAGIIMLVGELPCLEELRIESCDIGSTLISTDTDIGPLSLKKINCHFVSADGIRKLVKLCPFLKELTVTHLSEYSKDAILEEIAVSNLSLNKVFMAFFSFSKSMYDLLMLKGSYLTFFSLWEIDNSLTLDAILALGTYCPNLDTLCLMTQSKSLTIPRHFRRTEKMFTVLRTLTIGNANFNVRDLLLFFLGCTRTLQVLVLKYQTKVCIDDTMLHILGTDSLSSIVYLWLDCTFEVSKEVMMKIIQGCAHLNSLTVDFGEHMRDVQKFVSDNNLDLKLGSY